MFEWEVSQINTYTIERLPQGEGLPALTGCLTGAWARCPAADIGNYIWDKNGYKPRAQARVMYSDAGLYVYMCAWEDEVRAQADMCGMICQDSCLEFFLQPNLDISRYVNLEMNPLGRFMCGMGKDRYGRFEAKKLPLESMDVRHSVTDAAEFKGPIWEIAYTIPAEWLKLWFDAALVPGAKMRGNFYKCGDLTRYEHYGMWNPVRSDMPDFHRPESFGELTLG